MNLTKNAARQFLIVSAVSACASVISFIHFSQLGMPTGFRDGVTRLMLGRSIGDALNPGIHQSGGIWPWLPQLLMQPLIRVDAFYKNGFAGAFPQMVSFVVGCVCIYGMVKLYTRSTLLSVIAWVIYASPNMLGMQSVPMSESMFVASLVAGGFFLALWEADIRNWQYLGLSSAAVLVASQTRYEGYIYGAFIGIIVSGTLLSRSYGKGSFRYILEKHNAYLVLFGILPAGGLILWLVFSAVTFHSPIYFVTSDYSPWAVAKLSLAGLDDAYRTQGKLGYSLLVYSRTVLDVIGAIPIAIALVGIILFLRSHRRWTQKVIPLLFLYPFPFYVAGLYQGTNIAIWHPAFMQGANWATRYGTAMIPAAAFFTALAVENVRYYRSAVQSTVLALMLGTSVFIWNDGILSLGEAVSNQKAAETPVQLQAAAWLRANYDGNMILMQRLDNEWVAFNTGFHLDKIVNEGNPDEWQASLKDPYGHVEWVVMRERKTDRVWKALANTPQLDDLFTLVYSNGGLLIYQRSR